MGEGTAGLRQIPGHSFAQQVTCSPAVVGPLKGVSREVTVERSLGLFIENGLLCEDGKQGDYFQSPEERW